MPVSRVIEGSHNRQPGLEPAASAVGMGHNLSLRPCADQGRKFHTRPGQSAQRDEPFLDADSTANWRMATRRTGGDRRLRNGQGPGSHSVVRPSRGLSRRGLHTTRRDTPVTSGGGGSSWPGSCPNASRKQHRVRSKTPSAPANFHHAELPARLSLKQALETDHNLPVPPRGRQRPGPRDAVWL